MANYTKESLLNEIVTNNGLSVSHATMRNEDLIPVFIEILAILNPDAATKIKTSNQDLAKALNDVENNPYWDCDAATEDCAELFDKLDAESPNGFYFGSHIGDLSDYGFWRNEDAEDAL